MITRTLMLVEQRLVLTEEKMAGLARRQDEIVEQLATRKGDAKPNASRAAPAAADGGDGDDAQ